MRVLIIGGTGSLAQALVPILLDDPRVERIRILSRGEHAQVEMASTLKGERIDYLIGDVRDPSRIIRACQGIDVCYLLAAMKSVDKAEHDPDEAIKTNIEGARNTIFACQFHGVDRCIFTSTDKAVEPLNLYGATKLVAEKLVIQGNIGRCKTKFSVARYGNVFGSQGSVVTKWLEASEKEGAAVQITDPLMTRFFITKQNAAWFVYDCSRIMEGGEVFIPKMKATTIENLFASLLKYRGHRVIYDKIPARPGEKKHEILVSQNEVPMTTENEIGFIRWPELNLFPVNYHGTAISEGFSSDRADRFSIDELCEMWRSVNGT